MAQLTLDQLREFGLAPDTSLGQHFLVDDNILGVIERLAMLGDGDVCYEPGIGVGVLTDLLARCCAHVHGVEMDLRLAPAIEAVCADLENVTVHWGDAVKIDPATLVPAPTKLVSNLPYHVAAPIVAESLQRAPSIRHYCVMVQKEVGDRFFAVEGGKSYGALSALIRATSTRTGRHAVSRRVFVPPPNVDSVLVAFSRDRTLLADTEVAAFAAFTKRAFRHRRKTLSNNLDAAGIATKPEAVAALAQLGLAAATRPEQVSPEQFVELARVLGALSNQEGR